MESNDNPQEQERRSFLKVFLAGAASFLAGILPPIAGLGVFLDPLRRKAEASEHIRVTNLGAVPADGIPRMFSIITDRTDAWNRFINVPVGAVYLRRITEDQIEAYSTTCPHDGCFVRYLNKDKNYLCPCHNSRFQLDGSLLGENNPSPRGLDALSVEIREDNEVWVKFQKFKEGTSEQIPKT